MSDPLRAEPRRVNSRGEDLGDVLASIRRLIAQEARPDAQPAKPAPPVVQPKPVESAALARAAVQLHPPLRLEAAPTDKVDLAVPAVEMSDLREPAHDAPPMSPDRVAALTTSLADAVDAAAARMAATTRRVEEVRAMQPDAPFRLHPDALIPSAPLPFGQSSPPADALAWVEAMPAEVSAPEMPSLLADDAAAPCARDVDPYALPEEAMPRDARPEAAALQVASVHPTAIADSTEHPLTEQVMETHPLRHLLRDAIREELRGEIGQQFDGDLRRIVREELAAALTEAFGQRTA